LTKLTNLIDNNRLYSLFLVTGTQERFRYFT